MKIRENYYNYIGKAWLNIAKEIMSNGVEISRNDEALEYGNSTNKILTSGSDFHRLDDLARGGIITNIEIKDINKLVEILKSREYELIKDRHKMKESIQY